MVDGAGDETGGWIKGEASGQRADREGERHAVGVGEVAAYVDGGDRLAVVDGGRGNRCDGRWHIGNRNGEGLRRGGTLVVGRGDRDGVGAGLLEWIDGTGDLACGWINGQALGQAGCGVGEDITRVGIGEGRTRIERQRRTGCDRRTGR